MITPPGKSFLLTTFEAGGSIAPFVTTGRKLAAAGHRVRVMSDACNRDEIERAGLEFRPWTAAPSRPARGREHEPVRDWEAPSAIDGFAMMLETFLIGRAADFAQDVAGELARDPADLTITIDMLFGPMIACEALGRKWAAMACNVCPFPLIPGIPPLGPGLAPATTPEEEALHAEIAASTFTLLDRYLPQLNAARARFGLPPLAHSWNQPLAGERFLIAASPQFDFPARHLPARFAYVGPQLDDNGWSQPWRDPFPAGDPRPLVLVAFSTTFQDHAGVLQNVIDALATLPVRAVVTLGGVIGAEELSPPGNVRLLESAPHREVMREARLVVTHGGHGTVMKALLAGLPLLILPHGRDQADNAVRVTTRGAGLSLGKSASAAAIAAALSRLLDEETYARSAQTLGEAIRAADDPQAIVAMCEALAEGPVTDPVAGDMLMPST
jgi:MGT family glycosyltransferase